MKPARIPRWIWWKLAINLIILLLVPCHSPAGTPEDITALYLPSHYVFADHQLVAKRPDMGIIDIQSGNPWQDKKGLYWANPYNQKVWQYNLALCKELVRLGFDKIQFDYIRFPSDGNLSAIQYPLNTEQLNKTQCIGNFLELAHARLNPMGATLSVDVLRVYYQNYSLEE